MDNITHALTGLMMSRAGLNRVTPHATALLLLSSNAPDIDVVTALGGPLAYLDYHRGITHALVALPVMALLPMLIVRLVARRPLPWARGWLVCFAGVLLHLLMDWTNIYGIRLLAPFSEAWLRLDITPVVDAWIWAALLVAIAAPALAGLVSTEIGARPGGGRGFAIFALAFLLGYNGLRYRLHGQAVEVLSSRIYHGMTPRRVTALPDMFMPLRWRGVVETDGFYSLETVDLLGSFDPDNGRVLYKAEASSALSAARATDTFKRFLNFSQLPYWQTTPVDQPEGGTEVACLDLRFGDPAERRFMAVALTDASARVERAWFSFGRMNPLDRVQPR